jgi:hypothetical protein
VKKNLFAKESKRQANVYVFAILAHREKPTINPLNLDQWEFWVLPTKALNDRKRSQHSITIRSLGKLCGQRVKYENLITAVSHAATLN